MQKAWLLLAVAWLALPVVVAQPIVDPEGSLMGTVDDATAPLQENPGGVQIIKDLIAPDEPEDDGADTAPPEKDAPGFADRVSNAFQDEVMVWGVGSFALAAMSLGGFVMVTRYISPKEALKNPQRSMLYGYIRGNPGAHLKQLSDEFGMKTSSILWHIRKLESAELVNSERVGGYRVFYAIEGGIEIKRVSRAITALQNENAHHIFQRVQAHPGSTTREISEALGLHGGTARWHLRKLREQGLLDELVQDSGSKFFNTTLGDRALATMEGTPTVPAPRRAPTAVPSD